MTADSTRARALAVAGAALVALALALVGRAVVAGGTGTGPAPGGRSGRTATLLLAVVGLGVAAWVLRSRSAADGRAAADGAAAGATDEGPVGRYRLVDPAPERTGIDAPLAGHAETATLARGAETAREEGSVAAGVADVRPVLREVLQWALVAGGATPDEAAEAVDRGTWTDDPTAAAALSADVDPPRRSPWERLRAWLWPGRVARERIDRAVGAVAAASEAALPPVPGRSAPRRVRVTPPTLAELRRGVDGSLRAAVDAPPGDGPDAPAADTSAAGPAAAADEAPDGGDPPDDVPEGEP